MAAQASLREKLILVGIVSLLVITACVQLPDRSDDNQAVAVPLDDEMVAEDAALNAPQVVTTEESEEQLLSESGQEKSTGNVEVELSQAPSQITPQAIPQTTPQTIPQVAVREAEVGAASVAVSPAPASAEDKVHEPIIGVSAGAAVFSRYVEQLCTEIGNKLGSVSVEDCMRQNFAFGGGWSIEQRPLMIKEVAPQSLKDRNFRVFLMGGIHGDEYSSISIIFKWLQLFSSTATESEFYWRIAPLVNPDGLLNDAKAKRQNANGVDLNRNFPSLDWNDTAAAHWQESTGSNPRRFPGSSAASEPEVKWVVDQIEAFDPDVIVSIHAPYHLLDFDGPAQAPHQIGELYLHQLGVYPGSLGNYAGLNNRIPVVTLELPSAGILPPNEQIRLMWADLVAWLDKEGRKVMAN